MASLSIHQFREKSVQSEKPTKNNRHQPGFRLIVYGAKNNVHLE